MTNRWLAELIALENGEDGARGENPKSVTSTNCQNCENPPSGLHSRSTTTDDIGFVSFVSDQSRPFSENSSGELDRVLRALDARRPHHVDEDRWRRAVEDGRCFLETWGAKAEALGWTSRDLFGLHKPPANPHPSYRRLSRYDETGLIWLLGGREVIALTEDTAVIRAPSGSITTYRKNNKPALGPLGDSLDDVQ
jgi:hypothetical protein